MTILGYVPKCRIESRLPLQKIMTAYLAQWGVWEVTSDPGGLKEAARATARQMVFVATALAPRDPGLSSSIVLRKFATFRNDLRCTVAPIWYLDFQHLIRASHIAVLCPKVCLLLECYHYTDHHRVILLLTSIGRRMG
jgi:hypothetical protein